MGTKANPGAFDCYADAHPDEPIFVLFGRDKHAPTLIWLWACLRELDGEDPIKVDEARGCVVSMLRYQHDNDREAIGLGSAVLAGIFDLIRVANDSVEKHPNPATRDDFLRQLLAGTGFQKDNAMQGVGHA